MRGKLLSRSIDEIMKEAEGLVKAGVKELLIISQDTSAYGSDIKYRTGFWGGRPLKSDLQNLCEALGSLGIWIRLHYVYPYPHVDNIIPLMATGKILPYLDIPFQHGSPNVLRRMRRPAATENNLERISAWREICPDITIRSTFIVGFPGETEAEFDELIDFLKQAKLDRVGCFQYSPVEGAKANALTDPVDESTKQQRWERFMQVQAKISEEKLQTRIGSIIEVLIDEIDGDDIIARSYADAPEIDGNVFVQSRKQLSAGDLVKVKIDSAGEYDLWGTCID